MSFFLVFCPLNLDLMVSYCDWLAQVFGFLLFMKITVNSIASYLFTLLEIVSGIKNAI